MQNVTFKEGGCNNMLRQIFIPRDNCIKVNIPYEFLNHKIELIAFPIFEKETAKTASIVNEFNRLVKTRKKINPIVRTDVDIVRLADGVNDDIP
jgi:hypothetical protein